MFSFMLQAICAAAAISGCGRIVECCRQHAGSGERPADLCDTHPARATAQSCSPVPQGAKPQPAAEGAALWSAADSMRAAITGLLAGGGSATDGLRLQAARFTEQVVLLYTADAKPPPPPGAASLAGVERLPQGAMPQMLCPCGLDISPPLTRSGSRGFAWQSSAGDHRVYFARPDVLCVSASMQRVEGWPAADLHAKMCTAESCAQVPEARPAGLHGPQARPAP